MSRFSGEEHEFFHQLLNYLVNGSPPAVKSLRLDVLPRLEKEWRQDERRLGSGVIEADLIALLTYATSKEMSWELHSATGFGPEFASKLLNKVSWK